MLYCISACISFVIFINPLKPKCSQKTPFLTNISDTWMPLDTKTWVLIMGKAWKWVQV